MPKTSPPPLVLLHDTRFAEHAKKLAASLGVTAIAMSDADALPAKADIVFDVDLHDLGIVDATRRLLARLAPAGRQIFLIDGRRDRVGRVQAEALGASSVVERAKAFKALLAANAVPRLHLPANPMPKTRAGRSIAAAGQQLARLFDGVLSDEPIDIASLSSASSEILSGLHEAGVQPWLATVRQHHEGTFQHCLLVCGVAATYAQHIGLGQPLAIALLNAAMLHDIGKSIVPLSILDKPGRLSPDELVIIQRHPAAGYDYLMQQPDLPKVVLDAVRHHHEMLDGSGYPDALSGNDILPLTRVLTVCDIFAALTEHRPYKPTQTPAEALAILACMVREGKLDGSIVRNLGQAFDIYIPTSDLAVAAKRPYLRA